MSGRAIAEQESLNKTTLGFWIYLMTDCVLFASLFATFAVLRSSTAGGPSGSDLFDVNFVFIETMILLASSLTSGLALVGEREKNRNLVYLMLGCTFLLGVTFLFLELNEFKDLIGQGFGPQRSAFLSSYFTLVGTHGAHIFIGLLWISALMMMLRGGLTPAFRKRLTMFSMFWHFLDIIWIFIFTLVYLAGVLA